MDVSRQTDQALLGIFLRGGLPALIGRIVEVCGRNAIFANAAGQILAGRVPAGAERLPLVMAGIPLLQAGEYYYHRQEQWLFYGFGIREQRVFLCFTEAPINEIQGLLKAALPCREALLAYVDLELEAQLQSEKMEQELVGSLIRSSANIHDIIGFHRLHLLPDRKYAVLLLQPGLAEGDVSSLVTAAGEICRLPGGGFAPIAWHENLLVILPEDGFPEALKTIAGWQLQVEARTGCPVAAGLGNIYGLSDLHRSYLEAKMAMAFPDEPQDRRSLYVFSELGIFSLILSQEIGELKAYVWGILGPILSYDGELKLQLLETLRILLQTNFNWAKTAQQLFAHVNTIHYRYEKIEKLTGLDLSTGHSRNEMFAALKVLDVLNRAGFITEKIFGGHDIRPEN